MAFEDFEEVYLDELVAGFPCYSSPRFNTSIATAFSGAESRNRHWQHPLHRYKLPEAIREQATYETVHDHWLVMGGPEKTWPFRDPMDFASVALDRPNVEPALSRFDQSIGVGDGFTRTFQLYKTYTRGSVTYTRPIYLPITTTVLMGVGGTTPALAPGGPYTVTGISRPGGIVTFDIAPQAGLVLSAGFLFDVQVRFEGDDSFDGIVQSYQIAGYADLSFVEVRPC